ncbi:hypothetical protein SNEBB_006442 [Seison nebaliae]|nr:hypothetical protein SNEBB_006442 [Seison nebaliae]
MDNKNPRMKMSEYRQTEKSLASYSFRLTDIQYNCRDNYEDAKQEILDQFRRLRETVLEREAELLVQLQNKKLEDMSRLDRRQKSLNELTSGSGVNGMDKNELIEFQRKSKDFLLGRRTDESLLKNKCYHPTDVDDLIYRIRMFGSINRPKTSLTNGDHVSLEKKNKSDDTNGIEIIRRKQWNNQSIPNLPSVELQRQTTNMLMSSISDLIIEPIVDELIAERDNTSKDSNDTINIEVGNDLMNEINNKTDLKSSPISNKDAGSTSSKEAESINQIVNEVSRKKFNYNYRYNKHKNWKNDKDKRISINSNNQSNNNKFSNRNNNNNKQNNNFNNNNHQMNNFNKNNHQNNNIKEKNHTNNVVNNIKEKMNDGNYDENEKTKKTEFHFTL